MKKRCPKHSYIWVLLLCVFLLFLSCQPTPHQEIIVNRSDDRLDKIIDASAKPIPIGTSDAENADGSQSFVSIQTQYGIPEEIHKTIPLGDNAPNISIDVFIQVPDTLTFPVYRVRQLPFSKEEMRSVCLYFAENGQVFSNAYMPAKTELLKMLAFVKDDAHAQSVNRDFRTEGFPSIEEMLVEEIELTENDPETEKYNWDAFLAGKEETNYCHFYDEALQSWFNFIPLEDGNGFVLNETNIFIVTEDLVYAGDHIGARPGRILQNVSLTRAEAEKKAEQLMKALGATDMVLSPAETQKAVHLNGYTYEELSQGWFLVYRKSIDGMPCFAQQYDSLTPAQQYNRQWPQERISMYVDSQGIWYVQWQGRSELMQVRNDNIELLPFEKIWTVLEGRLRSEFSWSADKLKAAEVTDISLGYCVIRTKNEEDIGSSIPAWLVTVRSETKSGLVQYSDFMINAVTGEFIQTDADHK